MLSLQNIKENKRVEITFLFSLVYDIISLVIFMEKYLEIERSIIKKFRKEIWTRFVSAVKDFELIQEGDKIAVCISGGKDSFLLAKCMQELLRHGKFHYQIEFIVMNPGYDEETMHTILENLKILHINAHIFDSPIFEVANANALDPKSNPCYLCARMRRGYLYSFAKELGCNKIALGHHYDDVIETLMLNLLYNGSSYERINCATQIDHFIMFVKKRLKAG